jgi:hypothetical protein
LGLGGPIGGILSDLYVVLTWGVGLPEQGLTVPEVWVADRVLVSGAAFCPGDRPYYEYAALCDTSECLVFVVSLWEEVQGMFLPQGQGQSAKEVLSRIDFGGCITLFLTVSVIPCMSFVRA